jgi:hypothetical protein
VHDDIVRRAAEAGHLGVVADLEVEGIGGGSVRAGHEEQCVALRSELVRDLFRGNSVDGRLDLARRHARIEDLHVRPEVRCGRRRGGIVRRGGGAPRHRQHPSQDGDHAGQAAKPAPGGRFSGTVDGVPIGVATHHAAPLFSLNVDEGRR